MNPLKYRCGGHGEIARAKRIYGITYGTNKSRNPTWPLPKQALANKAAQSGKTVQSHAD
jgi:hypothetical protein